MYSVDFCLSILFATYLRSRMQSKSLAVFVVVALAVVAAVAHTDVPINSDPDLNHDQQQAYTTWRRYEVAYEKNVRAQREANTPVHTPNPNIDIVTPGKALPSTFAAVTISRGSPKLHRLRMNLPSPRHAGYGSSVFDRLPGDREELATLVKALPESPIKVIVTPPAPKPAPKPDYEAPTGKLTVNATIVEPGTIKPVPASTPVQVVLVKSA